MINETQLTPIEIQVMALVTVYKAVTIEQIATSLRITRGAATDALYHLELEFQLVKSEQHDNTLFRVACNEQ